MGIIPSRSMDSSTRWCVATVTIDARCCLFFSTCLMILPYVSCLICVQLLLSSMCYVPVNSGGSYEKLATGQQIIDITPFIIHNSFIRSFTESIVEWVGVRFGQYGVFPLPASGRASVHHTPDRHHRVRLRTQHHPVLQRGRSQGKTSFKYWGTYCLLQGKTSFKYWGNLLPYTGQN